MISQNETPGLGTRVQEQETTLTLWTKIGQIVGAEVEEEKDWFFLKRYRGLTLDPADTDEAALRITGVTITTSATTLACREALKKIRKVVE